jgi:putative transposase
VNRFGGAFAKKIGKKRRCNHSNWRWHLDEVFVEINGERFLLWRTVDHEGEVLEAFVSKKRCKRTALRIPGYRPTHSNNMRPPVPGYAPSVDVLP